MTAEQLLTLWRELPPREREAVFCIMAADSSLSQAARAAAAKNFRRYVVYDDLTDNRMGVVVAADIRAASDEARKQWPAHAVRVVPL
jgi:CBS domain containing-hemolysin-like protein